jgi:hypothetical protein
MRMLLVVFGMLITLVSTEASAQPAVNLTGQYRCVQLCQLGHVGWPAYVTQNGWNINLLNEAGQPSRAWFRWGGRIWAENWNVGAVYSPDGLIIQFDNGTIWRRYLGGPVVRRRP